MTTLIELVLDTLESRDEIKAKRLLESLDKVSSVYIKQRGLDAVEWIKREIWKAPGLPYEGSDVPLNEEEVDRIINHIANGHLDCVDELLEADLVFRGNNPSWSRYKASSVLNHLVKNFILANAAGNEAKTGAIIDMPASELSKLGLGAASVAQRKRRRVICPYCYRTVREWDPAKSGYDFGPNQIKCKKCGNIIPTYLIPWNKRTTKEKRRIFAVPVIIMIASLILYIPTQSIYFLIFLLFGLFWVFYLWRQGQVSLKIPTW